MATESEEAKPDYTPIGMTVPIERVSTDAMFMRQAVGTGKLNGRKFEITSGMEGSIHIDFEKREGETGLGEDRFIVRLSNITQVIAEFITERDEGTESPSAVVSLTAEQAEALVRWSRETEKPNGCSGYGPTFDGAMDVAHAVRKQFIDHEGIDK